MGFNKEAFLQEFMNVLEEALEEVGDISVEALFNMLDTHMTIEKQYAKDCGYEV